MRLKCSFEFSGELLSLFDDDDIDEIKQERNEVSYHRLVAVSGILVALQVLFFESYFHFNDIDLKIALNCNVQYLSAKLYWQLQLCSRGSYQSCGISCTTQIMSCTPCIV